MAKQSDSLSFSVLRLARVHFLYIFAFAVSIIVYDSSKLISPNAVLNRWKLVTLMVLVVTSVWYFARAKKDNISIQKGLVALLVFADILFASFLVYADRGMASLAVALFAVPIITSASLWSRSAVLATATLCTAAYGYASVKYFVDFFNEGYKVQLYSTIGFYGAIFFVIALLVMAAMNRKGG